MDEIIALLNQACRYRKIAEDYAPEVGAPLLKLAEEIEARVQLLQPQRTLPICTGRTHTPSEEPETFDSGAA